MSSEQHERERKAPEGSSVDDREIHHRGILGAAAGIVGFTVLAMGAMVLLIGRLRSDARSSHEAPVPVARERAHEPVEPRLEPDPKENLLALRAEETKRLSKLGWADDTHALAELPIDVAIEVLAARGRRCPEGAEAYRCLRARPPRPASALPPEMTLPSEGSLGDRRRKGRKP